VASTGLASTLLINGATYHSIFKLYPPISETSVCQILPTSDQAQAIIESSLIIWDEISLATSHSLIAVDNLLQELQFSKVPFGGKCIILGKLSKFYNYISLLINTIIKM